MISFCLSPRVKVILSWLSNLGIRKNFLVLGLIALSACNIDNENEELDTLPKLCAKCLTRN
jgi:undecaprenyl pyrophosphate synthase